MDNGRDGKGKRGKKGGREGEAERGRARICRCKELWFIK